MQNLSTQHKSQSWLSWFYRGILILGLLVLIGRLAELSVIKGSYYQSLAEGNRIRRISIDAPRGRILARGGEVLAGNNEVKKTVVFDPIDGYEKSVNISGASDESIVTEYERFYEMGADLGQVTGYLGIVDESEAGKSSPDCQEKGAYSNDSLIGKTGLEKQYECRLRGINGEQLIEVDSTGQIVRVIGRKEPVAGDDIRTHIDHELQSVVVEAFEKPLQDADGSNNDEKAETTDRIGAVVITDAKGEVLAMHSQPGFDPSIFVDQKNDEIEKVFSDPDKPLFNRVMGGSYHPGSVFKPFVALAALETGAIDQNYTYNDTGSLVLDTLYGTYTYNNWYLTQYGGTEGEIDLRRALARSTDTFFYKVGELTGMDRLNDWMGKLGLGTPTGIDLPGEISGLVPSPKWKESFKNERWFLGNTYHFAIGQGDTALTPLQVNTATVAVATGELCKPRLFGDHECKSLGASNEYIDYIRNGMIDVCSTGGTAFPFFDVSGEVACKTGTAETGSGDDTHAWFTFYWPVVNPELFGTILVEKGGEGSKAAAPIARDIYRWWKENSNR